MAGFSLCSRPRACSKVISLPESVFVMNVISKVCGSMLSVARLQIIVDFLKLVYLVDVSL